MTDNPARSPVWVFAGQRTPAKNQLPRDGVIIHTYTHTLQHLWVCHPKWDERLMLQGEKAEINSIVAQSDLLSGADLRPPRRSADASEYTDGRPGGGGGTPLLTDELTNGLKCLIT